MEEKDIVRFRHGACGGSMVIEIHSTHDDDLVYETWAVCENGCQEGKVLIQVGAWSDPRFKEGLGD